MKERFVEWCAKHHNNPDIINLRWWLDNRTKAKMTDTEQQKLLASIRIRPEPMFTPTTTTDEKKNEDEDMQRNRIAKGKPAASALLKTLKPGTIQAKLIEFILGIDGKPGNRSVDALCDDFMMERHSLMTQLNVIARTTGIGYSVAGDEITLTLPPGVADPFEFDM